jgi:hypothetical protein
MQQGFDILAIYKLDISLGSGAGQHLGKKPMAVYAAALYDDPELVTLIRGSAAREGVWFQEDDQVHTTVNSTTPVWGDLNGWCGGDWYWAQLYESWLGGSKNQACGDPYGYIDGPPGGANNPGYQTCCSIGPFFSFVFAMHLMPYMKYANNDPEIIEYIDRMYNGRGIDNFSGGWWAAPDPCAPPDPRESSSCQPHKANDDGCVYFKKTWGPDPAKPGDCIKHNGDPLTDGRWSSLHGTEKPVTGWLRRSFVVADLWDTYRDCADPEHPSYPCAGMGPEVEGSTLLDRPGMDRYTAAAAIRVYPNPSSGSIFITGPGAAYLVYDRTGDLVQTVTDNMASLEKGLYLITTRDHSATKRVMVIK